MTKLPEDLRHLNLTNAEYEALSLTDKIRLEKELKTNDAVCFSESHSKDYDLTKLPCVINGILIY